MTLVTSPSLNLRSVDLLFVTFIPSSFLNIEKGTDLQNHWIRFLKFPFRSCILEPFAERPQYHTSSFEACFPSRTLNVEAMICQLCSGFRNLFGNWSILDSGVQVSRFLEWLKPRSGRHLGNGCIVSVLLSETFPFTYFTSLYRMFRVLSDSDQTGHRRVNTTSLGQ
ncbi:hypothetical protein Tco_0591094 [Tanacetum coccineum]